MISNIKILPNSRNWFGWLSLVLTVLFAVFWCGNMPLHSDDYMYTRMPGPDLTTTMWLGEGEPITSVSQLPEAIMNHRQEVNGRLANLIVIIMQLWPFWINKYFCGLLMAVLAWQLWRWYGKRCFNNQTLAVGIPILFWAGFQWYDQMQSTTFQMNYTFPSVLMMGCLFAFYKKNTPPGFWSWLLLVIFSVSHEGFVVCFATFLGVYWLYRRRRTTFIALIVLAVGLLWQLSKGTQDRIVFVSNGANLQYYSLTFFIATFWLSIFAVMLWLWCRKKMSKYARKQIDRFGICFLATWIPFAIMTLLLAPPQRAHWPNDLLALCFIVMIVKTQPLVKFKLWLKAFFVVLYSIWGITLVYWEYRVKVFTEDCVEQIKQNGVVVRDKSDFMKEKIPFWLMNMVKIQHNTFAEYEQRCIARGVTGGKVTTYIILPDSLYGKPFDEWPKIPGNNDMRFANRNMIVRKKDNQYIEDTFHTLSFGKATISTSPLDLALGYFRGCNINEGKLNIPLNKQSEFVYLGDTLECITFRTLPRSYSGREIVAID